MTDRELLEMAAKAAGIEGKYEEVHEMGEQFYSGFRMGAWKFWNPLTNDGDALRLAVKLDILSDPDLAAELRDAAYADEPNTSTRRAIVRAAAEIGKAMK